MRIDLNADLGESSGESPSEDDLAILRVVSSVSLASGSHAGSLTLLGETIRAARSLGVAVGAHPSFEDREHFGRREVLMPPAEVEALVARQLEVVAAAAASAGVRLRHVKPHGALYNMAARDALLARAVCRAVRSCDPRLLVFGPPRSHLLRAAEAEGLAAAVEVFADRAYRPDGSLAPRSEHGAVISSSAAVAARAVRFAIDQEVEATDGSVLRLPADTICLHGDSPDAAQVAAAVREALTRHHVEIRAVGER